MENNENEKIYGIGGDSRRKWKRVKSIRNLLKSEKNGIFAGIICFVNTKICIIFFKDLKILKWELAVKSEKLLRAWKLQILLDFSQS